MRLSRPVLVATVLLVAITSFLAGGYLAAVFRWRTKAVTARVENRSGEPVASAQIEVASCGGRGVALVGPLAPGASREIPFSVCGEATYALVATFGDGRTLRSRETYVETGYSANVVIGNSSVVSSEQIY